VNKDPLDSKRIGNPYHGYRLHTGINALTLNLVRTDKPNFWLVTPELAPLFIVFLFGNLKIDDSIII
jgi:hypothetical protein